MRHVIGLLTLSVLLIGLSGCSYVFYPHAKEFAEKAKGSTELDTLGNLADMMEASAKAAKGGKGYDQPLNDLHNQFHAFDNHLCCLDETKQALPAYDLTVTHNKELWAIFKRIWKFKDDQPQRDQHLDLFVTELQELRTPLQVLN